MTVLRVLRVLNDIQIGASAACALDFKIHIRRPEV